MGKKATKNKYIICQIQAIILPKIEKCDEFAGSITLETALVLPIFLMIVISLFSTIELIREYVQINEALYQVGKEIAFYEYPYEQLKDIGQVNELSEYEGIEGLAIVETYARARLITILGQKWIDSSMVKGGALGFHLYRSEVCNKNNEIDLVLTYKMKPWFSAMGIGEFYLINRCRLKAWTGYEPFYDENGDNEEYVYVAENGQVYHLYEDCSHLMLSIQTVGLTQVEKLRNEDGCIYKQCEYCIENNQELEYVYLTNWGDKYHSDIGCSGLKRTVRKVKKSEVTGLSMCVRCGKRQG